MGVGIDEKAKILYTVYMGTNNAVRFISAYNQIDKALHARFALKSNITFADAVRAAAVKSAVVRKYADDLYDYGRLRNAIVHKSNTEIVIAEPHVSVADKAEYILSLITAPPRLVGTVAKEAAYLSGDTSLFDAVRTMAGSHFSFMPVVHGGEIIGVFGNKTVVEALSCESDWNAFALSRTVRHFARFCEAYYEILPVSATADDALRRFEQNRKLQIIILTDSGTRNDLPRFVVTTGDIVHLAKLIEF